MFEDRGAVAFAVHPAHRQHVAHREIEGQPGRRAEHRAQAGQIVQGVLGQGPLVEADGAGAGPLIAGQGGQQRALAGPVGADQHGQFAGREGQRGVAQDRPRAALNGDLLGAQAHRWRERRMSQRKNGAPRALVSSPTGISAGATRVRAPRSAAMARAAPSSAEAISSTL